MTNSILHIDKIQKVYGDHIALSELSFNVNEGEIFGLIGPDGAGKTTLIRILTTLLLPTSGKATVMEKDLLEDYKAIRLEIGYMPGKFSLYGDLSIEENLKFFATIYGTTIEANYNLIKDIYQQIEPFKDRKAGQLSGGMKQKLALCCALIHRPKILFLDEPTTGIDAVSRVELWDMLKKLKSLGLTIIVSTPYMDEAVLCDRVAFMQNGHILEINSPQQIIENYNKPLYTVKGENYHFLLKRLREQSFVQQAHLFGETIHITCDDNYEEEWIENKLNNDHPDKVEVKKIKANIEDCFMEKMIE